MKKLIIKAFILLIPILLTSCIWPDTEDDFFTEQYDAVVINRLEFENSTALMPAKPIVKTGKIYVKGSILYINQPNKGFHVFDNSNPLLPINIAFLKVLGATDLSIKNNVLYINNATDLIAVKPDFSANTVEITKRIINTFPELASPNNCCYKNHEDNEVIIDWVLTE